MVDVKWLIETDAFDGDADPLVAHIQSLGMQVKELKYLSHMAHSSDRYYDDKDCVVFYGSLGLGREFQRARPWVPGVICTWKNFECTSYYAHFGGYLLNADYVMMPLGEMIRRRLGLMHHFHVEGQPLSFFVRPNSGFKTFTGIVLDQDNYQKEIEWFREYGANDETLVVVSKKRQIDGEWRFLIADGQPVAASQYKKDGEIAYQEGAPEHAWSLARDIARRDWQPDPIYVLDVCHTPEHPSTPAGTYFDLGYYLMEVNSFSCSGLYQCDPKQIVPAACKVATREWESVQE